MVNVISNRNEDALLCSFLFALALFFKSSLSSYPAHNNGVRSIHTRLSPRLPFTLALTRHGQARRVSIPLPTSTLDHGHVCLLNVAKCRLRSFPIILPSFSYFPFLAPTVCSWPQRPLSTAHFALILCGGPVDLFLPGDPLSSWPGVEAIAFVWVNAAHLDI